MADKPPAPFRIPPGIKLVRVNLSTGLRARRGRPARAFMEAFKPDEEPDDAYSVIGFTNQGTADASAAGRDDEELGRRLPNQPTAAPERLMTAPAAAACGELRVARIGRACLRLRLQDRCI